MAKKIPSFTFSNTSYTTASDDTYWYIYLKATGNLTLKCAKTVDVCIVGGGGGGAYYCGGGGAGGYVVNEYGVSVAAGKSNTITIGEGAGAYKGSPSGNYQNTDDGGTGGTSSAFGYSAAGGSGGVRCRTDNGYYGYGGSSGTGKGGAGCLKSGGAVGRNGGDGAYAFGGSSGTRYGAGGGGGSGYGDSGGGTSYGGTTGGGNGGKAYTGGTAGAANTGAGGGGAGYGNSSGGGKGGSGIVIIRGTQEDNIPVIFNGTTLEKIIFNGTEITSLIFNGTKLYFERLKRRIAEWFTSTKTETRLKATT